MPADKAQGRGRSGPRHAAPRKPLLTRLNIPAGKAVAVAAVPTAMLVGMGFTPQLAQAKPLPKNPFKGDACVSAPDKEETEAEQEKREERAEKLKRDLAKEQAKREKAAEDAKEKGKGKGSGGDSGDADKSGPSDGTDEPAPDPAKPSQPPSGGGEDADKPSTPAPDPSESEDEENPWYDPLGVGKKLEDAFTPKDEKEQEDPAKPAPEDSAKPTPTPSAPSKPSEPSEPSKPSTPKPPSSEDGEDASAGDRAEKRDGGDDAAKKQKDEAGKDREKDREKDKDKPGANEQGKDGKARAYDPDKDAGKPFPCPEKGDYEGKGEQTPATIPNQPWYLKASSLTLRGASYKGIVEITMPNGKTKQALKYTSDELDIGDLHQTVDGPSGKTTHVKAAEGSTSTIRGGQVTMYTEELKGKLFGLIPMTFSPESPPPLDLPFIYLTDVEVRQAAQFGGNLTVPGLHTYLTD
ncbi:hypothetical protein GCM10009801_22050 [Streptomyces albiaxialis]|uniref:Hydrogenase expression protein HypF n=1 Tax=Streptomyces albiaxialis TaxID=329523 RepID=A0ABP5HC39_9ACTN